MEESIKPDREFRKTILNPLEILKNWVGVDEEDISHISFNPSLKESEADYHRSAGSSHDSTLIFTIQSLGRLFYPLCASESSSILNPPDPTKKLKRIRYEIGNLKWAQVFGTVNICGGKYPGLSERMRISVKCYYDYE